MCETGNLSNSPGGSRDLCVKKAICAYLFVLSVIVIAGIAVVCTQPYWLEDKWTGVGVYPGTPYNHNRFRAVYSDHSPVAFEMVVGDEDDD